MRRTVLVFALFAAFFVAFASADCSVSITQTLGSAWKQSGADMSQWDVAITAGSSAIKSIEFSITGGAIEQLWELELDAATGHWTLPLWRQQTGGLPAGTTHKLGYIWPLATKAAITVTSINCGGAETSPEPNASESPVVSTPQPSSAPSGDCSVSKTQSTRSASTGGSWTDGNGFKYQIYDLVITNDGNKAISLAQITINLGAGQQMSQYWNLELVSGTTFKVTNTLVIGNSYLVGYIVKSPLYSTTGEPAITFNSLTCAGPSPAASPSAAPASPFPSAAPANPSASPSSNPAKPSASPSAHPTTTVSTPQPSSMPPSSCNVIAQQSVRSANEGGSWNDGTNKYQLYDLLFINNGEKAATLVQVTINLAANQQISQYWNLELRSGSSFNVARNFGALQVAANISTGYVVKSPLSANDANPTIKIDSVTCSGDSAPSASPSAAPVQPSASPSSVPAQPSSSPSSAPIQPSVSPSAAPVQPSASPSPAPSSGDECSAIVNMVARSGGLWQQDGQTFQIFDITITNTGQHSITSALMSFSLSGSSPAITQYWELQRLTFDASSLFRVSFQYGPLLPGLSQGAGITVSVNGGSTVPLPAYSIGSVSCGDSAPPASPSAAPAQPSASPSAAPVQPSASPSAFPSIVASPAPSGGENCSAIVNMVARSGGLWQQDGQTFQIYDITITNTGQHSVTSALMSFTLSGSSPVITQYWELQRLTFDASSLFRVSFQYGPLLPGLSQGAGITVSVNGGSMVPMPAYAIGSVAC